MIRYLCAVSTDFRKASARELGFTGRRRAGHRYHAEGEILEKLSIFDGVVLMNGRIDAPSVPIKANSPVAFTGRSQARSQEQF